MEAPTKVPEQPTKEVPLHQAAAIALTEAGHPNPTFWHMHLHPHGMDEQVAFDIRRFLVNRAFEMTIGGIDPTLAFSEKVAQDYARDQLDARYCLLPQGTQLVWLNSFKEKVVPFIMKYQLGVPREVQPA
jgi:hypothetical protein